MQVAIGFQCFGLPESSVGRPSNSESFQRAKSTTANTNGQQETKDQVLI